MIGSKECVVTFNKTGYDPFIDYLKGICILLVVLTHCFPKDLCYNTYFPIWGFPAVPLFLLIQVFHTYKKGIMNLEIKYKKLWKRIMRPFIFVEMLIFVLLILSIVIKDTFSLEELKESIVKYINKGGEGPGSYYPWIYMQFAIVLPLFAPLLLRMSIKRLAFVFVVVSMAIEFICNLMGMSMYLYRILFVRYFFIIYLGFILVQRGIVLNKMTVCLSVISILATLFFAYSSINLEPYFYTVRWKTCHWICYIYEVYILLFLIKISYRILDNKLQFLSSFVCKMGKHSYAIFLFQMVYFTFSDNFRQILHIRWSVYIVCSVMICIMPVVFYNQLCEKRSTNTI